MSAFSDVARYRAGWTAGIGVYKMLDGNICLAEGEDEHGLPGSSIQYRYLSDDQAHALLGLLREVTSGGSSG